MHQEGKFKASSTESGSDAEKLDPPHTDGKTITPENGLAATHAIYHVTRIYTARQLSQRNETMGSKAQILHKSVYSSSSRNSPKLETTLTDVLVTGERGTMDSDSAIKTVPKPGVVTHT